MCRNLIFLDILLLGERIRAIERQKGATGPDLGKLLALHLNTFRVVHCKDCEKARTSNNISSRMRNQRNHLEWSLMQKDASN
jgi:predicted nucleic-acid-binding Zn-ribbon protein